jgi:threonine synthase
MSEHNFLRSPGRTVGGAAVAEWSAICRECGTTHTCTALSRCPDCGGLLVARAETVDAAAARAVLLGPARTFWDYRPLLPPAGQPVTLGEGGTPLVRVDRAAPGLDGVEVLLKLESLNPTLSFKDRAMALGVSAARWAGARGVLLASTGNAAVSAAAYAARAGLPCRVYAAAASAESLKLGSAAAYGAQVVPVPGDYSSAWDAAARAEGDGWVNLTTTYRNPLLAEAHRTVAFELAAGLAWRPPALVAVPVGAGPLLYGLERGFDLLHRLGLTDRVPRLVAVQAAACAPIVRAWRDGAPAVSAAEARPTIADAIADPLRGYEDEAQLTLEALRRCDGAAVAVGEDAMRAAVRELATAEGVDLEPAAAACLPALTALRDSGALNPGDTVVAIATGHGAKERRRPAAPLDGAARNQAAPAGQSMVERSGGTTE